MKTIDYINILIKEKENLTEMCKSHAETIRFMKREIGKLNNIILKKDKKIQKLENESLNIKTQKERDKVKKELNDLNIKYRDLQNKYTDIMKKNEELMCIFDEIENESNSD